MSTTLLNEIGEAQGRWWSRLDDGRLLCQLCPRACRLRPGDRGFCFVRKNVDDQMVLDTYGKSTGFCIDPIEKKPLNHFLPGTPVLSFGTAGCNLGCKFCQNWDISKSREIARLSDRAMPEDIASAAVQSGCRSVAFTYNDPVIWAEYAIDTAAACRAVGVKSVAVTAGYITEEARGEFYEAMDAANIDLKAFTEDFYYKLTGAHLDPVLDTIRYVCNQTDCWVELTNLIIPQANDSPEQLQRMCDWVLKAVGDAVPVHFTAFHPDFRLQDRPATPHETLIEAYDIARRCGLKFPYVGNVHDGQRDSTFCPECGELLIERDWHQLGTYALKGNQCSKCGCVIPGHFEAEPGQWGRKRQPVRIVPAEQIGLPKKREDVNTEAKSTVAESTAVEDEQPLSEAEKQTIHAAACRLLVAAIEGDPTVDAAELLGPLASRRVAGVFVTVKRGTALRGCIGHQGERIPLAEALRESAWRTATQDPRVPSLDADELPYLTVSVTVLKPAQVIEVAGEERLHAVEVGRHGLRIRMGDRAGILLPSVATEQNWNARQFLDAVCRKAGLASAAWRNRQSVVETFEGEYVSGAFTCPEFTPPEAAQRQIVSAEDLEGLRQWVAQNVNALQRGATPFYYATGVGDGSIAGALLQVHVAGRTELVHQLNLSVRTEMPLQATLFQMTQQLVGAIGNHSVERVDVAIFANPIQHGTLQDADLRGVSTDSRALFISDGRRMGGGFDPQADVESLSERAVGKEMFSELAEVYSVQCQTTAREFAVHFRPQGQAGPNDREPAVAGVFYPADDTERRDLITSLLEGDSPPPRPVSSAMVPHAGLRYSGRVAAEVWQRIALPETVIIIGPKHTRHGVDWAVAPHAAWRISEGVSIPSDPELAARIAESVDGMQLDAAAHAQEHGIEVQLPILEQLSAGTKVVGIAIGGATLKQLERAADQLAELIRSLPAEPLLVISSDMNHFADDEETRRRDRLALEQLQRGDPAGLLETCRTHDISMCGRIPAALVLLTLQRLGKSTGYEQVAYATSADTTGDTSRVVGYAGALFG